MALLMGGQVAFRGAVAVYTVLLAAVLSQAEYGDFAAAISAVAIVAAVADGGVTWLLTREITLETEGPGPLVRKLLTVRLVCATGVCGIAAVVGIAIGARSVSELAFVVVVAVAAFIESLAAGYEAASLGAERPVRIALGQGLGATLIAAGTAVLFLGGASPIAAVAVLAASSATRAGVLAYTWRSELRGGPVRVEVAATREVLARSLPFLVLIALGAIYYRADVMLLHAIVGARETAEYAAAFRFVDAAIVLSGVLVGYLMPRMARAWRDDPGSLPRMWRRAVGAGLAVSLPATVLAIVFSDQLAELLFGTRYRTGTGEILRLLAPTITLSVIHSVNAAVLFSSGRTRALVGLTLVYVAVSFVSTAVVALVLGAPGAAGATTGSAAFTFLFFAFTVRRWSRDADGA